MFGGFVFQFLYEKIIIIFNRRFLYIVKNA